MKLNLDYTGDPRWDDMSVEHKKTASLPNLFLDILYKYQNKIPNLKDINFAVETGTHDARTSKFLADHFDVVFTIELFPDNNPYDGKTFRQLYEEINKSYNNLNFLFGNSTDVLSTVLSELPNERFLILLDAHTMLDGPLKYELEIIKKFSSRNDHVILVDDCRDLGKGKYPTLSEFTELIKSINPNYTIEDTLVGNNVFLIY
jgi:hypothetical protein